MVSLSQKKVKKEEEATAKNLSAAAQTKPEEKPKEANKNKPKRLFSWLPWVYVQKKEKKPEEAKLGKIKAVGAKIKNKTKAVVGKIPQQGFLSKMYLIVKKDIALLIRSKSSAVIFLLGPLVVFLLASLAFTSASSYNFKVGVYSESYSLLTESLIGNLSSEYFVEKINTIDECLDDVKLGTKHLCIVFPKDMVIGDPEKKVEVYVDVSRRNIADFIINEMNKRIELQAEGISATIVSEMITIMENSSSKINDAQTKTEKVQTKNAEVDSNLEAAVTEIGKIDFKSSTFDTTAVSSEIDSVVSEYNLSSSDVSDLRSKVDSMKNSYDTLRGKLLDAETKTTTAKTSIEQLQTNIKTNAGELQTLKTQLGEVASALVDIKIKNATSIVRPIDTDVKPISQRQGNLFYSFPTLVMLLVTFFSILMSATVVVREKDSKAYFRNLLTPTYGVWFVVATYIANMIIIGIQGLLIFIGAAVLFKGAFVALGISALALGLVATVFIFLGTFVGFWFDSEETVMLASICLSSIFVFFSNTILPLESVGSNVLFWITHFNPFVIGEGLVKWFTLFGFDIKQIWTYPIMLVLYAVVFFTLSLIAQKITKKRLEKAY